MAHSMVWMSTDEIIKKVPCTCIDGRTPGMRFSVAGGSFGLILHTLGRIQAQLGRNLQPAEIEAYIRLFADEVGPVYLHTDQHKLDCIYSRMGVPKDTKLKALTANQRRSFCELATEPEFQGCGHLHLMMTHEAEYGVPLLLIQRSLKAFLTLYFNGHERLMFDVLSGRHQEERVLLLDAQRDRADPFESALYLEAPQSETSFFCHRPLKKTLAQRFLEHIDTANLPGLPRDDWDDLVATHNRAAEHTLERLAPQLPVEHVSL